MVDSEYKPRLKDKDFKAKGAQSLNETELNDVSVKCWGVLRPQVTSLGLGGEGMSASFVQGYIWGFVDAYLQQFRPPCTVDSFYEVINRINASQLGEINLHNLKEEQLSNQIAEPNADFFTALFMGGADGTIWAVDHRYKPSGLQALFDEGSLVADGRAATNSVSYELGQKVGGALRATKSLGIFDKLKLDSASTRLSDDDLFEQAYDELQNDELIKSVWARALSESDGDEKKAEALYLKLRVQQIKDEKHVSAQKKQAKKKAQQKKKLEEDKARAEREFMRDAEAARLNRLEQERQQLEMERLEEERLDALPERSFSFMNIVYFIIIVVLILLIANTLIEHGKSL